MIDDLLGGNWRRQHHKVSEGITALPGDDSARCQFLTYISWTVCLFQIERHAMFITADIMAKAGSCALLGLQFKSNMAKGTARQPQEPKAAKIAMSFLDLSRVFSGISLKEALPLRSTGSSMFKAISCKGNTQKRRTNVFGKAGSNFSVLFGKKGCSWETFVIQEYF